MIFLSNILHIVIQYITKYLKNTHFYLKFPLNACNFVFSVDLMKKKAHFILHRYRGRKHGASIDNAKAAARLTSSNS